MKFVISYISGQTTECRVFERPSAIFKANHHKWNPFKMRLVEPCDIVKDKPEKFSILTVDDEGYMIEKWTFGNIESISEKDSIISVKFGYCILNY